MKAAGVDGRTDGWMGVRMDGWMDVQMDGAEVASHFQLVWI